VPFASFILLDKIKDLGAQVATRTSDAVGGITLSVNRCRIGACR
jgi:hypothetical protein